MKKSTISLLRILVVFITFIAVLRGNQLPELVPYHIVPLDPIPDCRLELGIELIHPYKIEEMPEPQREETLEIIYKRIAYEVSNPNRQAGMFEIDGKMYHLIRIPYTGASTNFWGWE
tara:strand:+ start:40 stop:390 length:351 start_codon:yes stop_codon:yes gene_type:complete